MGKPIPLFLALLFVNLCICYGSFGQSGWDGPIKTRVSADSILDRINNGEDIQYGPDSIILGDLAFDRVKNKAIEANITINSDIYGSVIAENKIFNGKIDFNNSNLYKDLAFSGSRFSGKVIFNDADFKGKILFNDVIFKDRASFQGIICEKSASFYNASFKGPSRFNNAIFNERADFSRCTFNENGQFQYVTFKGRAFFYGASFKNGFSLNGSDLAKDVEFSGANFEDDAKFDSIKCESTMRFNDDPSFRLEGAKFNGLLSFKDANIKYIDLNNSYFCDGCQIFFNNCDFNGLNAKWNDIKGHIPFNEDIYIKFINYYKSIGSFDDADACYREYYQKLKNPDFLSGIRNFFFRVTCNYGTNASYPLIILFISLFLFAFLYWIKNSIKRKDNLDLNKDISFRDCLYFSATVLINYSNDYIAIGRWRWLAFFECLLGWTMLGIFIITLVRLGLR